MNSPTLIAGLLLGGATLAAAAPEIFPTPRKVDLQDTYTRVSKVQLNMREATDASGMWEQLPADNAEAYALTVTNGKLTVWANSETAVYYAKQTLSQMLRGVEGAQNAQRDPFPGLPLQAVAEQGELPLGSVLDWPDLPFRGAVEGYYGAPWSFEARKAQFDFYGRNKMNTYIYAPKDDPYHHGLGCYEPYPAEKAAEIRSLVQHAQRNHVRFVWAIHPANTVKWAQNGGRTQLDALCHKLQLMYELGVRDFGVLVDDSSGEIGKAERQVQLCNYILENFIRKHPDVNQTLIMCPTGYNKAWTNKKFLQTLGNGLDKSIPVMWTGDTVVHDITLQGQQWVNAHVKRPTFIWWNWPCNDFKRSRISMGRTYGLGTEPEMKSAMSGFVANPMEHAEAGKVGLFGVADYTWNITSFESDKSWRAGIARLYPGCADAMQCFCEHNSYLLPNGHGYYREESVHIAPTAAAYTQSLEANAPDTAAAAALKREFERMECAGTTLQKAPDAEELRRDIAPWISQFILAGRAGTSAMNAIQAEDAETRMQHFFRAVNTNADMENTERDEWTPEGTVYVKDTEVAMYCMTPAVQATLRYLNPAVYAALAERKTCHPAFTVNGHPTNTRPQALADNNAHTFWCSEIPQKKGDCYSLDFGELTDIRNIVLTTGKDAPMQSGQFEISTDGSNWFPIGAPKGGQTLVLNLAEQPVQARMLRYRVLEPQAATAPAICEYGINRALPPCASHNLAKAPRLLAFQNEQHIGLNRIMEVFTMQPGEYIELQVPATATPSELLVNLANADIAHWAEIALTHPDGTHSNISGAAEGEWLLFGRNHLPDKPISAARLTNRGNVPQEVKLSYFRLGLPAEQADMNPAALTDSDFTTFYNNGKARMQLRLPLPPNTAKVLVIGTADCTMNGASPSAKNDFKQEFTAPQTGSHILLSAPRQEGRYTYEIIFVRNK